MKEILKRATKLAFDSREVEKGTVFFAMRGTKVDGHEYIQKAVEQGAIAVICEKEPAECSVPVFVVEDAAREMGLAASEFWGNPSTQLKLVGVTGTNGKTTTATLLYDMFTALGYRVGLISTVEYRIAGRTEPSTHTTPDVLRLNALMAEMVATGCDYCFMEVSSHSIVQQRTAGLTFAGGIFSNLTHDHLDYHGTFAEYLKAKKMFFDELPAEAFALTNLDDRNGRVMVQNTRAREATYSTRGAADFTAHVREMHLEGMLLEIDNSEVWVRLLGRFNASNLLAVYAAARLLGVTKDEALKELSLLQPVDGRFHHIGLQGGVTAIVDYAHTPDALQNVLDTINEIRTGGRLIVVVGCGGDRDATKRPIMARIAATNSDLLIITSDNPRTENPAAIIADMVAGLSPAHKHLSLADRREAISAACTMASAGDIILVAGKGHETYQEINGVRNHFSDTEELQKYN